MGSGARLFPDKNTPTGPLHNKAKLKITLNGTVAPGLTANVYVRLFDVDDPTAFDNAVDLNDEPAAGGTGDQFIGSDNRGMMPFEAFPLTVMAGQDTITHEYTFSSLRAGDNYRAFASTNQTLVSAMSLNRDVENGRSQINPFRRGVAPFDVPPKKLSSVTLALWRKLYLEVDAMRPGTLGQNRHMGPLIGAAFNATTGETTFRLPIPTDLDFYQNDQFKDGWIQVYGQATAHAVTRSALVSGSGELWVIVNGSQAAGPAVNALTHVYDDDDDIDYSPTSGFSYKIGPTITDPDTSELAASLREAFFVPIIDTGTSDALIAFDRNVNGPDFNTVADADRQVLVNVVTDTFIAAHLASAFQGPASIDADPDEDIPHLGETVRTDMASLIYKEPLREYPDSAEAKIVAHEIGHLFESAGDDFHSHGGVMSAQVGLTTSARCAAATLDRIRSKSFNWL